MLTISAHNMPEALYEACWKMKILGKHTSSRNGVVMYIPTPTMLAVDEPDQRVIFDRTRQCNHAFHMMEFVWMMSGSRHVSWLEFYNSRMREYADENGVLLGAYGYRWREQFDLDQVLAATELLHEEPDSRQAVIAMWDPRMDNQPHPDKPCNTHIYLRINGLGELDMTVCNRSNDLVWGMLGANAVHMTMLQELIARQLGRRIGTYYVMTNNLHIYKSVPNYDYYMGGGIEMYDLYNETTPYPILTEDESMLDFISDCEAFVLGNENMGCEWMQKIANPVRRFYTERKLGDGNGMDFVNEMPDCDWKEGLKIWVASHN